MSEKKVPVYLTQEQAENRSKQILKGSINYNLSMKLQRGQNFNGKNIIEFETLHINTDLFLDFKNTSVDNLIINSQETKITWDGLFLNIPKESLKLGLNTIEIDFSCKYANDGSGLHSFTDTDGKQYIYSECEAYKCNRIFPNFDQPDLKAYLQLEVEAPQEWRVLSNEKPITKKIDEELYQLFFPKTKLLPTYLYAIIAGPYFEIAYEKPYIIPMSLYCRQSLFDHLKNISDLMFEVTTKAMKMYEDFFGHDYSFNKYDQIFCPEYNMGAMENAGMVVYNDLYVWREEVDSSKNTWLANVVTHELAHHWFGNLVTMKWWNDLWLNESFADFISHFCLSKFEIKSKQLQEIWLAFNMRKGWGYRADQASTTHPIAGEVKNTQAADNIFDGITYAKGASVLKQLLCLSGEEDFSKAMGRYFHKYAFSNATLDDFIQNLDIEFQQKNHGFTLQEWKDQWICTAGLNECLPQFDVNETKLNSKLLITQSVALKEHPTLRYHKMKVAFFDIDANITSYDVLLKPKSQTILEYDGTKNFKAVLLNYEDESFIKVLLDETSLQFFIQNLHKIQDTLTRTLIWRSLFDMVRDGKLASNKYIDIAINQFPLETSNDIITNQMKFVQQAVLLFTPPQHRQQVASNFFNFCIESLQKNINPSNQTLAIAYKQTLVALAISPESAQTVLDWHNNKNEALSNHVIGVELEWEIVCIIHGQSKWTVEEKDELFKKQAQKDSSDTLKNMEQKCQALKVNSQQREELWNSYFDKDIKLSLRLLQHSWSGFNNASNMKEVFPYYQKWFTVLQSVYEQKLGDFAQHFTIKLAPQAQSFESEEQLIWLENQYNSILEKADKNQLMMIRKIKEQLSDLQLQKAAFNCFNQSLQ